MLLEIVRLVLGLVIAALHKPIADFICERERSLVLAFRQRGMLLPAALSSEAARTIYFGIGIFIAFVEMLRLCQLAR